MKSTMYIDDVLTVYPQTSQFSTGAAFDATGSPAYRVYEGTTDTPILTGSFALVDDANTVGFYGANITLSAANGFEVGKCYCVRETATVDGVAAASTIEQFVVRAQPLTVDDIGDLFSGTMEAWTPAVEITTYAQFFAFLRAISYYSSSTQGNIAFINDETDTAVARFNINTTDTTMYRTRPVVYP